MPRHKADAVQVLLAEIVCGLREVYASNRRMPIDDDVVTWLHFVRGEGQDGSLEETVRDPSQAVRCLQDRKRIKQDLVKESEKDAMRTCMEESDKTGSETHGTMKVFVCTDVS